MSTPLESPRTSRMIPMTLTLLYAAALGALGVMQQMSALGIVAVVGGIVVAAAWVFAGRAS